jgi:hypothetical protein
MAHIARRAHLRSANDGTMPMPVADAITNAIKVNDTASAKRRSTALTPLSPEARAEWRTKVAWAAYINNQDNDAYAQAINAARDPMPPTGGPGWLRHGGPPAGRMARARASRRSRPLPPPARAGANQELVAAANYWQSRAHVRCRQPELAAAPLQRPRGPMKRSMACWRPSNWG